MSNWKLALTKYGKQTIFSRSFLKKNYSIQDSIPTACVSCKGRVYSIGMWRTENESELSDKWLCFDCGNLHLSAPKVAIPRKKLIEKEVRKEIPSKKKEGPPKKKEVVPAEETVYHVPQSVTVIKGVSSTMAQRLYEAGIKNTGDLINANPAELKEKIGKGVSEARIKNWIQQAKEL